MKILLLLFSLLYSGSSLPGVPDINNVTTAYATPETNVSQFMRRQYDKFDMWLIRMDLPEPLEMAIRVICGIVAAIIGFYFLAIVFLLVIIGFKWVASKK